MVKDLYEIKGNKIIFQPWQGEFGWEIMSWIPFCRATSQGFKKVEATSYPVMQPLYDDFVTDYKSHDIKGRGLNYPKMYRVKGVHRKYGNPADGEVYDIAIHARGINRKIAINYKNWLAVINNLRHLDVIWIGGPDDRYLLQHGLDCRNITMGNLVDMLAASKLAVGCSSGVMHLAAACGTDLVVWGDQRTYFGETLERRYKQTWNPHNVNVQWIDADDWQPDPREILKAIEKGLTK